MRNILLFIHKEFLQLRRDRRMLPMILVPPILQLLVFGYAAVLDVRDIPTLVCDLDRSAQSRDLAAAFFHSGYFTPAGEVDRPGAIDALIDEGRAELALVVPRGFGRDIVGGRPAAVQLIVDGAESQSAVIGLSYAGMILAERARGLLQERLGAGGTPGARAPGQVAPRIRILYNPELGSRKYFIPGVVALLLMVMTLMLTSMAVVKEKELGTLEQLIVTPIRPFQLILGKLTPFVLIGMIDVTLVVSVAALWFKVDVRGSVPLLFALSLDFMLTTLGIGLLVSTLSRNQQQAMLTAVFFMIPMILLSGFVFPIENMPPIIQAMTYAVPLRYFLVIVRGLFTKGVGLAALWDEALILFLFGAAILTLSVARFRKRLE